MKTKARIIAIYLPQYHPIPENDAVWGKGFTEWTNVAQAKPLFRGHYQPRIPRDFGFYDLRIPDVREMQAEYARDAGIEGFMYWQYYFGRGKMLLERPFEEVLRSGKPDFPFCLGWANHSWQTKTWTKSTSMKEGKTLIMEQYYDGTEQYTTHFYYNLPAFRDKRYITVDGKPMFVIWNPGDHPDEISILIKTWRNLAKKEGLEGIHFVGQTNIDLSIDTVIDIGFDAVYDSRQNQALSCGEKWTFFHRVNDYIMKHFGKKLFLDKHDFGKCYRWLVSDSSRKMNVYPTLLAGYDRSPRSGKNAQLFYNFTPDNWRKHIHDVLLHVEGKDHEHNIIMLKSWNEWGESNYIEPDIKFGTAMLDVLGEEIKN